MVQVIKKGIFTTLQTLPQQGWRSFGVSPRGPMDVLAHRAANALLGNPPNATVMEMHYPAPLLQFETSTHFVLTGGDFGAILNHRPIGTWQVHVANKDDRLQFAGLQKGFRGYLGIAGGFAAIPNRYENHLIQTGDSLLANGPADNPLTAVTFNTSAVQSFYEPADTICCMAGPEYAYLADAAQSALADMVFSISPTGNRMGLALQSPIALAAHPHDPLLSGAVAMGTVQLLPNGQCLVLMADHNTTGGYPRIAAVLESEWPKLAQLRPGQPFRLQMVSAETASQKYLSFRAAMHNLLCTQ
jgi:antagonist of KipI